MKDLLNRIVVLRTGPGDHHGTMRVYAVADFPTLEGIDARGRHISWALHLSREATPEEVAAFDAAAAEYAAHIEAQPETRGKLRADGWAIVELMGHGKIAGRVTEREFFIRVHVPETKDLPAFTKDFGTGAIFGITYCTAAHAQRAAEYLAIDPLPYFARSGDGSDDLPF